MTNPQQQGNQGLDQYNQGGRYTSPEEALKQELIDQGYDPNTTGFWDTLNNMVAQAKANMTAEQQRTQQSQQLSQDVEYRSGLQPSNTDYQGIPHEQMQTMVQGVNPGQVTGVSSSWTQLANAMATFGQQLGQAATKSGATWKGDAAESAYGFVSGLGTWSDQSGQAAQLAADQVYSQSSAAETAKNSMPDPIPFSWTDEMKSWASSNPFNLVDNIDQSFEKQQQSQDAHDQAAQVMSSYDNNLYTAASKAPAFNPPPTFEGPGGASVGHASGSIEGTTSSSHTGSSGNLGGTGGTGGSQGQVGAGSSGSLSGSLAGLSTPALNSGVKTGGSTTPGKTSAQGYQPPNSNPNAPSTSGLGQSGLNAMGGMPMGAMGAGLGGGGGEYSSKVGRGGGSGFGPGGSGGGSAASSGSAGAGAQSGARAGGAGAAETAAGAGGRGAAGSTGRGGMGGMGHGGKGQGDEDDEHQRPSWLIEPDPDDVFGTSERTAPPVIGE